MKTVLYTGETGQTRVGDMPLIHGEEYELGDDTVAYLTTAGLAVPVALTDSTPEGEE